MQCTRCGSTHGEGGDHLGWCGLLVDDNQVRPPRHHLIPARYSIPQRGDYQDTSAVVQAALHLLAAYQQERDATLHDLRTAIDAGDASGEPVVLEDEDTFLRRAYARTLVSFVDVEALHQDEQE